MEKTTELTFTEFYKRLKQALSDFYKRIFEFFKRLRKALWDKSVPITRQLVAEIEVKSIQRKMYFRKKRSQAKRKTWRKWG